MSNVEDNQDIDGEEEEETIEYICKRCPGKTFTADEKDAHKLMHKMEKKAEKEKEEKPGPKTRSSTRARKLSLAVSEEEPEFVGIKQEIKSEPVSSVYDDESEDSDDSDDPDEPDEPQSQTKRKSKKHYDEDAIEKWVPRGKGA